MNYRNKILNTLIDKYENSKSYKSGTPFTQRPRISCRDMIEVEDYEQNSQFLSDVIKLKELGLIDFDWERKGYVADKVFLVTENAKAAYEFLGRTPKKSLIDEVLAKIAQAHDGCNTRWIKDYLALQAEDIRKKVGLTGIWKNDISLVDDILSALCAIDKMNGVPMAMRAFSVKLYNDSKHFEYKIKKYIIKIAQKNEPELRDAEELSDREILRQIGIIMMPEVFEFCGNLTINFKDGAVDFSPIKNGSCICGDSVSEILSAKITNTNRIVFIENKTNYSEYCLHMKRNDELVVFHGGFYSPQHGEFFRIIYDAAGDIPIYFWADIDLGGFKMFVRLKENIIPRLIPMNMTASDHNAHKQTLLQRGDDYIARLLLLCGDKRYAAFDEVIHAIAQSHGTIEQECFLLRASVV